MMKIIFLIMLAISSHALALNSRCLSLMDYVSQIDVSNTEKLQSVISEPQDVFFHGFKFDDAKSLIESALKDNTFMLQDFKKLVQEEVYDSRVRVVMASSLTTGPMRRSSFIDGRNMIWIDGTPRDRDELRDRLLETINFLFRAKISHLTIFSAYLTYPAKEIRSLTKLAEEMLAMEKAVLQGLSVPIPSGKVSLWRKLWRLTRLPISAMKSRQQNRFSEVVLDLKLDRLLEEGKIKEVDQIIRRKFGRITYFRWTSQLVNSVVLAGMLVTSLTIGTPGLAAYIHSKSLPDTYLPYQNNALTKEATTFFRSSLDERASSLHQSIHQQLPSVKDEKDAEFLREVDAIVAPTVKEH